MSPDHDAMPSLLATRPIVPAPAVISTKRSPGCRYVASRPSMTCAGSRSADLSDLLCVGKVQTSPGGAMGVGGSGAGGSHPPSSSYAESADRSAAVRLDRNRLAIRSTCAETPRGRRTLVAPARNARQNGAIARSLSASDDRPLTSLQTLSG